MRIMRTGKISDVRRGLLLPRRAKPAVTSRRTEVGAEMQFEVLGPLRMVAADGTPSAISSRVQRRLLSLLIVRAGAPVSADYLAESLDLTPGALRVAVSRLRRLVGADTLVTAPPGYDLRPDGVDTWRFEQPPRGI